MKSTLTRMSRHLSYILFFTCMVFSYHAQAYYQESNGQAEEQNNPPKAPLETETKKTNNDKAKDTNPPLETSSSKKAVSKVIINPPMNWQATQKEDITHFLPREHSETVLAGPNDYLTLVMESHTALNKGVVILLPDLQQGATTPKAINYLRKALPENGWTTFTVQPRQAPINYPSVELDKKLALENNKKALTDYQEQLTMLMQSLLKKAQDYPGVFLVVAQGQHAALLVNIYSEFEDNDNTTVLPSALIMLSPYLPTEIDNTLWIQKMALLEMPILDLTLNKDHPITGEHASIRKKAAQKEMKVYYRAQQLNTYSSSYYPEESLMKAIKGWLSSIGW